MKMNYFLEFIISLLESTSNFKHFQKKMILIANIIPELRPEKNLVRPLSEKRRFRTRFESQHVKAF